MRWRQRLRVTLGSRLLRLGARLIGGSASAESPTNSPHLPPDHWLDLLAQSEVPIQWQGMALAEHEQLPLAQPPQSLHITQPEKPQTGSQDYGQPIVSNPPPALDYSQARVEKEKPIRFEPIARERISAEPSYQQSDHTRTPHPIYEPANGLLAPTPPPNEQSEQIQADSRSANRQLDFPTMTTNAAPQPPDYPKSITKLLSFLPWRYKRKKQGLNSAENADVQQPPTRSAQSTAYPLRQNRRTPEVTYSEAPTQPPVVVSYSDETAHRQPIIEWNVAQGQQHSPQPFYPKSAAVSKAQPAQFSDTATPDNWPTLPRHPLLDTQNERIEDKTEHLQKLRREQLGIGR